MSRVLLVFSRTNLTPVDNDMAEIAAIESEIGLISVTTGQCSHREGVRRRGLDEVHGMRTNSERSVKLVVLYA